MTNWDYVSRISEVFSAVGTVGAVIVALYFSSLRNYLKIKASLSNVLMSPYNEGIVEYCQINVINAGIKPFKINGFYIKCKKYELNYAFSPDFTIPFTTSLNFIYGESESGNYFWKKEDFVYHIQSIIQKIDKNHSPSTILKHLEFYIQTNLAELARVKPDPNFYKHCLTSLINK
jgi:hypothetical protein